MEIKRFKRGFDYLRRNQIDLARAEFEESLRQNPDDAPAHFGLGCVYALQGLRDKAVEEWTICVHVEPRFGEAHYALSWAYYDARDYEKGWEHLKLATDTGVPLDAIKDLLDRFVRTGQPITHVKLKIVSKPKKFINFEILKQVFISIFLIALISFFTRNFLTEGYLVGWDSMTHVFKTWFTMEWLSGRASFDWCEYWYQGSPIMPMYGPLFYVLSGLLGRISGIDALAASKWVVFLSFPASSLFFYFSTRRKNFEIASVAGAVLYGLIPWHLTYITILGNPTYSLSYLFVPPLFKFVKEKKPFSLIYASITFCMIMLSHQGTGFLFAYALIWYGLFSGLISYKFKKSLYPIIKVGLLSVGLLSFFGYLTFIIVLKQVHLRCLLHQVTRTSSNFFKNLILCILAFLCSVYCCY